jgi:hypothetical protein
MELRRASAAQQDRLDVRVSILRLIVFLAALVISWLSFGSGLFSGWWLLLPAAAFLVLLQLHERIRVARGRFERAAAYYSRGIDRIEGRWRDCGEPGNRFLDEDHPYAGDLDIFGTGSLFQLICGARTRAGEETLASWLRAPASAGVILARQEAIEELRAGLDLREDLAVLGAEGLAGVNPGPLSDWGAAPPLLVSRRMRIAAALLSTATTLSLASWLVRDSGMYVFLLLAALQGVFSFSVRRGIQQVLEAVERPGQDLDLLSMVLRRLELERFQSSRLAALGLELTAGGTLSSRQIAGLNRRITMQKQLFRPIAALLLWDIQMAYAIESWRIGSGRLVARWLAVCGEMEALCSLAGYAYEHPLDPFPEIAATGPHFEAEGMGHPLIHEDHCVRNDLRLSPDLLVLVVSGSNMSGKSTLLRTVGTNAVLGLAGSPVRARRLKLSPLVVGASVQRKDSLHAGTSRFYAEITRLRHIVDLTAGGTPLLFLLDELLHGTNSRDRGIGAEAFIRDLVRRGAFGLLTTHDLALAHIADVLAPRAENVHFEDAIENGKLVFDYRLRPGIVRRSNALELMRSIGLEV